MRLPSLVENNQAACATVGELIHEVVLRVLVAVVQGMREIGQQPIQRVLLRRAELSLSGRAAHHEGAHSHAIRRIAHEPSIA